MARPKVSEQIDLETAVRQTAWQQIAANGAAALSLRAIARELGITAPAIYNYFPRRDDLVTALIVEAFRALGESQHTAVTAIPASDLRQRLSALALAYRAWALAYPQRYHLIFGTPLPGYEAPADVTVPAAAAALEPLVGALQAVWLAGRLKTADMPPLSPALRDMLAAWQASGVAADVEVLYLALVIWSRVHGLVLMEIGGHFPGFITDPGEIFRREVASINAQYVIGE